MNPFHKLATIIAEEFARQTQNRLLDLALTPARRVRKSAATHSYRNGLHSAAFFNLPGDLRAVHNVKQAHCG